MSLDPALHNPRTFQSIGFVVLGYFGYSVSDMVAKFLMKDYPLFQVMAMTSAISLGIMTLWALSKYGSKSLFPANLKLHLLRSFLIIFTAFFFVSALKLLPLADFYGIAFTIPFFTMGMAIIFLKEKIGPHRIAAAIFGFLGVLVLAGPQFDHIGMGVVFGLLGAFIGSFGIIVIRKIGPHHPVPVYGFWPFLFICTSSTLAMIVTGDYKPMPLETLPFVALGGCFATLGMACVSIGFARAPDTSLVTPFHYTQIIWGVAFGWIVFGTLPVTTTYIGLFMIVCAGLYSLWREYVHKHHILN